ncbi:MAG TPA: SBBP repeat-containing protein [Ignavibacteria bacterium]|nr:SBBP repeat-containing protein [Ignavibacteria bacterium]
MKKIIITFSFALLLFPLNYLMSQISQQWVARYSFPGKEFQSISNSVQVDTMGNVYITGFVNYEILSLENHYDIVTIKYNASGEELWTQNYHYGIPNDMVIDNMGNVYIVGVGMDSLTNRSSAITIKYNTNGIKQWEAKYYISDTSYGEIRSVKVDNLGNVYSGGYYGSIGNYNFILIKYNSSGSQQWVSEFDGLGHKDDYANDMALDAFGNIYLTGTTIPGVLYEDYATVKFNNAGIQQWVRTHNGSMNRSDLATCISLDDSGNVCVSGVTTEISTGGDYTTIKYNSSGIQLWIQRYNGPISSGDRAECIATDLSGNVYVSGRSRGSGTSDDFATVKYNSSGVPQWVKRFNGAESNNDRAIAMTLDDSSNVYVTGYTGSFATFNDIVSLKYSTLGIQLWTQIHNGPLNGFDFPTDIATDNSGGIYITGSESNKAGFDYNFVTIKYSPSVSIQNISSILPDKYVLSQNYPNPFNPTTNINFDIQRTSHVKIVVYDINGKEISTLVNEELKTGSYKADFDGSNLSSGIYYYTMTTNDFVETKKMILVK